jgi:hypothetical protein
MTKLDCEFPGTLLRNFGCVIGRAVYVIAGLF